MNSETMAILKKIDKISTLIDEALDLSIDRIREQDPDMRMYFEAMRNKKYRELGEEL